MKLGFNQFYLFIAGFTMLLVGGFISLAPNEYLMSMGTETEMAFRNGLPQGEAASTNLISDLRGMGGMLLFFGIYVLVSTFQETWRRPALLMSTLVFSAFVVFRTTGFVFDGLPSMGILAAYLVELLMAVIGLLLMNIKRRELI